jgi:hypothetical protein
MLARFFYLRFIILLAVAFWCLTSCADSKKLLRPSLSVPIHLEHKGIVAEFDFEIVEHKSYRFYLDFHYLEGDQEERSRVRKIIGGDGVDKNGKPREPGIPTPIKLTIFMKTKESMIMEYQKEMTPLLTTWGGDSFSKNLGYCRLKPGLYHAVLESFSEHSVYSTISTSFDIGSNNIKSTPNLKITDRRIICPQ